MSSTYDFRRTWLWRHAFTNPISDITAAEQGYFSSSYLAMREKAATLVSQIASAIPGLTVHDVTHLDALWETASLVSEGAITVSPAEAFIFGASVLLHDSAMSVAAYAGGLDELKQTVEWKDALASAITEASDRENPSPEIISQVLPDVLRRLHAKQAQVLAKQGWKTQDGETLYLIDDPELRNFYGETIGQIAHSHWWPISQVTQTFSQDLGAFPNRTSSKIDRIKVACLLRIADALHLDQRRAPRFLRALVHPSGVSAMHWSFQERLAVPHIEHEAVVLTSGSPFPMGEADAWWLAYDTMSMVDKELQDVDVALESKGLYFAARRVKGAGSPEALSNCIQTSGWRPVDAQLRVSDIPKVVSTLGGEKLYGNDPSVALRELIQNSADAIQARRRYQQRQDSWGEISIELVSKSDGIWLLVEDNGIGMSERVLTGPLIDFGKSFWRSGLVAQEFPGLISKGMNAIGRYGIGFFSVFMIGDVVRVISRRYDYSEQDARTLEFRGGTAARPILSPTEKGLAPIDGGTRIEVLLKTLPQEEGGLLAISSASSFLDDKKTIGLSQLVASIAPCLDVSIRVKDGTNQTLVVESMDWLRLSQSRLVSRLNPESDERDQKKDSKQSRFREILDDNSNVVGRACIVPSPLYRGDVLGTVTVGGLRAAQVRNISGVLAGKTLTASRDSAIPLVPRDKLAAWATDQAIFIAQSNADDEFKARCAEVVLECGGTSKGLPIVCQGKDSWLNVEQFRQFLRNEREFAISFDGEFNYDEDTDDVLPRDFRSSFEVNENILVVPRHNGSVLAVGRNSWPAMLTEPPKVGGSNLGAEVMRVIEEVWSEGFEEDYEEKDVGSVYGTTITRQVSVFTRNEASDETS